MCTNSHWITDLNDELKFALFFSINKKEIKTKEKNNRRKKPKIILKSRHKSLKV